MDEQREFKYNEEEDGPILGWFMDSYAGIIDRCTLVRRSDGRKDFLVWFISDKYGQPMSILDVVEEPRIGLLGGPLLRRWMQEVYGKDWPNTTGRKRDR